MAHGWQDSPASQLHRHSFTEDSPDSSALYIGQGLEGTSPVRSGVPWSPVPVLQRSGGGTAAGWCQVSGARAGTTCPRRLQAHSVLLRPDSPGRIAASRPADTLPRAGYSCPWEVPLCEGRTWASRILTTIGDSAGSPLRSWRKTPLPLGLQMGTPTLRVAESNGPPGSGDHRGSHSVPAPCVALGASHSLIPCRPQWPPEPAPSRLLHGSKPQARWAWLPTEAVRRSRGQRSGFLQGRSSVRLQSPDYRFPLFSHSFFQDLLSQHHHEPQSPLLTTTAPEPPEAQCHTYGKDRRWVCLRGFRPHSAQGGCFRASLLGRTRWKTPPHVRGGPCGALGPQRSVLQHGRGPLAVTARGGRSRLPWLADGPPEL